MIALLRGILVGKSTNTVLIDVQGVGYEVHVSLTTFYQLPEIDAPVTLHIYTHVREEVLALYGFLAHSEKELFLLLLGVSGVGPKLALTILSMGTADLVSALKNGHVGRLKALPGIGTKVAGRLVLELREKVAPLSVTLSAREKGIESDVSAVTMERQAVEGALSALVNLGYRYQEAKRVLDVVRGETTDSLSLEQLIKKALQHLAKAG